jgi:hypothetical protein
MENMSEELHFPQFVNLYREQNHIFSVEKKKISVKKIHSIFFFYTIEKMILFSENKNYIFVFRETLCGLKFNFVLLHFPFSC